LLAQDDGFFELDEETDALLAKDGRILGGDEKQILRCAQDDKSDLRQQICFELTDLGLTDMFFASANLVWVS
jgi:hypothetical protein